jgi:hypothetical protein
MSLLQPGVSAILDLKNESILVRVGSREILEKDILVFGVNFI